MGPRSVSRIFWSRKVPAAASPWVGLAGCSMVAALAPEGVRRHPGSGAFCGKSTHLIPPLFPPYTLSKGHWGFPTWALATGTLPSSGLAMCSLGISLVLGEPPTLASAPGTSHCRSSGLFKGPAPRGGAAPLFIGTCSPVPSSEFLSQSGACSLGPATLVGGHLCHSLSSLPAPAPHPGPCLSSDF